MRYQTCYLSRRWVERKLGAGVRRAVRVDVSRTFVVDRDSRRITVDTTQFPMVARLAVQLASHWQESFTGSGGSASSPASYATSLHDLLAHLNDQETPPQDLRFLDDVALDGWVDDMRDQPHRERPAAPGRRTCGSF